MRGAKVAANRQVEIAMFTAYYSARLGTFTEKLEPLSKYLETLKPAPPRRRQTAAEMIAALRAIKSSVKH